MKRGDVVLIREPGTPAGKARPCVVIQRNSTLDGASKITVCAFTSDIRGLATSRPFVLPTSGNGLKKPSQVEVDWIYTHPITFVGERIGELDDVMMDNVDTALRRWLDL